MSIEMPFLNTSLMEEAVRFNSYRKQKITVNGQWKNNLENVVVYQECIHVWQGVRVRERGQSYGAMGRKVPLHKKEREGKCYSSHLL